MPQALRRLQINISGKPSYNTSPYAYSLIWEKNRASPGFQWGMENLSDCSELPFLHLQNLRDGPSALHSSIIAPLHPGMPGTYVM